MKTLDKLFSELTRLENQLAGEILKDIISEMMNASTMRELKQIRADNDMYFIRWGNLLTHYESASKRIENITPAKIAIWGLEYLN